MKPYFQSLPRVAHTAHRGGSALAPENTLVAFRRAVEEYHTDILELDVQPSADGHVVVIHDETLDRTTDGTGPVRGQTLECLRTMDAGAHMEHFRGQGITIPTLEEVLVAFPEHHINIELKVGGAEFMELFAQVVERHHAQDRLCIGHVDLEEALRLHARLPQCAQWYPEAALLEFFQASRASDPLPNRPEFQLLSVPYEYMGFKVVDEKLVRDAHSLGRFIHVWTVDERARMEELIALGVDGILTDRPDVLRDVLGPVPSYA